MISQLPKNWKEFKIIDIAPVSNKRVVSFDGRKKYIATGDLIETEIVSSTNILYKGRPSRADLLLMKNEVLFAKMQATKKVIYGTEKNEKYIYSTGFFILNPIKNIDYKYLYYFFVSDFFNKMKDKNCTGATQKALTLQGLRKINISLPIDNSGNPDLKEQKRIVSILEEAEQLKKKREEVNKKMEELIPALFVKMFGDPATNPMGWDKGILTSFGASVRYGLGQPPELVDDGIPLIRATNIDRGKITPRGLIRIKKEKVPESRNAFLKVGDVLVVRSGAYTGDVAVIKEEWKNSVAGYDLVVTPGKSFVGEFLTLFFLSSFVQNGHFFNLKMRAAQPHLNSEQVSNTPVYCPPIDLQNKFAKKIEELERQKTKQNKSLEQIDTLFNSLMQKAFSGKL